MSSTSTPAYLVYYNDQIHEPVTTLFTDANLLTARKAAMSCAESLLEKLSDDPHPQEIDIYLVELVPSQSEHQRIARPFHRYTSLDKPEVEVANGFQHRYLNGLPELDKEAAYYQQHGHSTGFGLFDFELYLINNPEERQTWTLLYDAMGYALEAAGAYNSQIVKDGQNGLRFDFSTLHHYPEPSVA